MRLLTRCVIYFTNDSQSDLMGCGISEIFR